MASTKVSLEHDARLVAALLDLPEIKQLIADLDETRWTGRPGYFVRTMVGAALTKAVYPELAHLGQFDGVERADLG